MAVPAIGTVVLVRFPFTDLSASKLRPAVVLANAGRGDVILCQITSQPYADRISVEITLDDFSTGTLRRISYARPAKLFTANDSIIDRRVGKLTAGKFDEIVRSVRDLFRTTEKGKQ